MKKHILLVRHTGFIDRFIACPFAEAKKPLGWSINWFTDLESAHEFAYTDAVTEAHAYSRELGEGYRVLLCRPIMRRVKDFELIERSGAGKCRGVSHDHRTSV